MAVEIKPWRLDPLKYEDCLWYVQGQDCERLFMPRHIPELDKLIDYICFLRGSYLVTGYRGVGKTSFINYALALANKQLRALDPPGVLIPVFLSLARNYETEKLLRRTIRQLYEVLIATKVEWFVGEKKERLSLYPLLSDDLKTELTTAYQKTSARMSEAATEALKMVIATATTGEFSFGGEIGGEAATRPDPLPAKLGAKLSGGYKRSQTTSREEETARKTVDTLEYLEYDDEIAEAELMRLIKRLARTPVHLYYRENQPIPRRWSWFWRLWGKVRHRNYVERVVEHKEVRNLHLVFVFDELDKVTPEDAEKMLRSLKGLLTTSDATFIFIGGWEFANRWLSRTRPEGDLLYSLFNDVIYIPLYSDEELDTLIDALVTRPDGQNLNQLWEHIKLHCGRTPRGFLRQLLRFVRWEQGKPILDVHQEDLFPNLFPHVHQVNSRIDQKLPPDVRDALVRRTDQWLMIAERESVFSFDALFKIAAGSEKMEIRGGVWQQSLTAHFERFLDAMLEAGVFQPEEDAEERYRFNPEFSLGTWRRQTPTPSLPEEPETRPVLSPEALGEVASVAKVRAKVPFEAPAQVANFVDREAELRAIRQALDAGTALIQVVGMGGIGKTTLAVQVAHEMRDRFPDGVVWVDLELGTTLESVLHHIASSYGQVLAEVDTETLVTQVRSLLADKKALLVLDSAENLSEDELKQLLPGTPNCPVLVTTRRLSTELERLGQTVSIGALPADHSLALLRRTAGYRRVSQNQDTALQVCQLLGYHPLAIELAGRLARAREWNMHSLLENLQASMDDISETDTPIADVSRAFSASYNSLTEVQQKVLMAGLAFEGNFTADGLSYLTGAQPGGIEYLLDGLVNRSLVFRGRDRTFHIHPLIRAYVRSVADGSELEEMRRRHARYMLRWVRKVKGEAK